MMKCTMNLTHTALNQPRISREASEVSVRLHSGIGYELTDSIALRTVSMKKLLSHIRIKNSLPAYLAHQ